MRHWISILGVVLSLWLVSPAWAQEVSVPTVNINTAGAAEIAEVLQGVGQAKADAIANNRKLALPMAHTGWGEFAAQLA